MDNVERQLLLDAVGDVAELGKDRDDLLIGLVAGLLDLYRALFSAALDAKADALLRLKVQQNEILQAVPDGRGSNSLKWLIQSLENERLDAAALLRMPVAGSA
jgi:hypothetical protein